MKLIHVPGKNVGSIKLYALSTCVWCKKTKDLLNDLGVEYDYVFVDLLKGAPRRNAIALVERFNPDCSFPTLVVNDSKCIVGFRENEIREIVKP